jgi:hypothetical protein
MALSDMISEHTRSMLRGELHKVAAIVAKRDGLPCFANEVTVKEAARMVGFSFWKNYLEKRAMLDGIVNTMHLIRG